MASGLCLPPGAAGKHCSRVCGKRVWPPSSCGAERGGATGGLCAAQVLLAAGDTYRAAAAEQLAGWAERSGAAIATASSERQRPDALLYSALDRVRGRGVCGHARGAQAHTGAGACRALPLTGTSEFNARHWGSNAC